MKYLTTTAAVAALFAAGGPAFAQPGGAEADTIVETCRAEPNQAARIACLELAIYRLAGEAVPQTDGEVPANSPAAPAPAPAELPAVTGIGAEQVENRLEREEPASAPAEADIDAERANVIGFARTVRGKLILVLDNGQVWAQRESDDADVVLVEGRAYPVEINEGFMSGYRMRFLDQRRILRVERLR